MITSILWNFGDNTTSAVRNPTHLYGTPGNYTVSLTISTADGSDSEIKVNYITVLNSTPTPPNAAFTATPTTGPPGVNVQFTDQSTQGSALISSWAWTFGDGGTSTLRNPAHVFAAEGSYDVSLTVTTPLGSDTETKTAFIVVTPGPPIAAFAAAPTTGTTPFTVNFTDQSVSGGVPITSWAWSFGDTGTSTLQNPSHTYLIGGNYTVSLTVTNANGSDVETKTNLIAATQGPIPATADFAGTPTSGAAPLTVSFSDSSRAGTTPITSRLWDFGDGNTSTLANPTHIYTTVGNYTVTLSVASASGDDSETKLSYIQVVTAPVVPTVDFSATPTAGVIPLTVNFTDLSANGGASITTWFWSFGDGGTSTAQNPTHAYTAEGTYTVFLSATNAVGTGNTTKTNYITATHVLVPPTAAFLGTPTSGDAPLNVQFTDQSTPGSAAIATHLWDFGDGGTSTATNPSHLYTTPGTYTVVLAVSTPDGDDTEAKASYIQVSVPPTAPVVDFSGTPTTGFAPLTVNFTDFSANGGATITSWSWTFGDGGTSTAQNPSHIYTVPGTYTVSLSATNTAGTGSTTKTGYITASIVPIPPVAAFSGTPTSGSAPLTVQFTDESTAGTSPITTRSWNFGDGGTSTATNPSHIYTTPGSYTVVLAVSTADGDDTEAKASYIQATVPPVVPSVDFTGLPTGGTAPLTVQFTDQSTNGGATITSWSWTFGDGGTSTAQNPSHVYAAPGTYSVSLTATNSVGPASGTKTDYITVSPVPVAPTAAFSGTPTSGATPLSVTFTDESSAGTQPITSWLWSFGDGGTSTLQSPGHTYTAPGSYTVTLRVASSVGPDSTTKASYITAQPVAPTAEFTGSPTGGFVPLTVNFTDQSTAGTSPISSWSWTFGDGGTSTAQNPSHIYTVPGTYNVSLTATSSVGPASITKTGYITASIVPVGPTAAFSGTPTSGDAPLTVQFTDESTAGTSPITTRSWDFGDGGTSTAVSPSHLYTTPGTYTVVLSVSTTAGDDTEAKASYIQVLVPPTAPTAEFVGSPTTGFAPLTVNFTDQSTNGGATITSWLWSFGDGGSSTAQNPSHSYTAPGTYNVSLRVANSVGPDSTTKASYITASIVPIPPVAAFSGTPTSGSSPLTVQFTDESTAGTSPITSRLWNFGDGDTSIATNPSHVYASPGSYTVVLSVSTLAGDDTEAKGSYIQVTPPPVVPAVDFSASSTAGVAPLSVTFTDLCTNGGATITSWSWNFGDGGTSTAQNPGHTYTAPGTYSVSLTATNSVGPASGTKTDYITVAPTPAAPTAAFSGTPTSGATPLSVTFTDESAAGTQPITSWAWSFGDGGTSTVQSPSHTYTAPGSYTVSLRVANSVGPDSTTKASYITAQPVAPTAEFVGSPTTGFAPLTVNFTDLSTAGTSPISSWSWSFGDGGTSTSQNPSHSYTVPGTYNVSLTATSSVGPGSITKTSYVTASLVPIPPVAAFSGTPTSGSTPLTVQFTDESTAGTSPITARLWDFGDGGTSTAQNPSHIYTTTGSYTVVLSVSTLAGDDTEAKGSYIQVTPPPVVPAVDFSASSTAGTAPLSVTFTDLSTNGGAAITSWSWTFGDGGTSTAQNPGHVYTAPGTYSVSLTATNSVGPASGTKTDYITVAPTPAAPTAAFSGTPTSGATPLSVTFTDESAAGTQPITSWAWSFGDGGTSTLQSPSHTYTAPGSYTVSLRVANSVGPDSTTKASYITAQPVAPTAEFSGTPTTGFAPLTVNFTDLSTPGTSPISSWSWSFGDGGTSTAQSPSHIYTVPGTYNVSLTATSSVGPGSITKTGYVTASIVPVGPTAAFSGTPTSGDAPLTVQFTDESTAGTSPITSRLWDFGDGSTSTAQNPSHNYASPGSYMVVLSVSTLVGDDSEAKLSYIQALVPPTVPTAEFSGTPTTGFAPLSVNFTDQSTNGGASITSWLWTFGDGGTSTAQNPSHSYATPGTYNVSLRVANSVGPDSTTKTNYITASIVPVPPTAAFSGTPTTGDAPLTVQFTDESAAGTSPITARSWDFGDGGTSTATNPSHLYTTPGTYTVVLAVSTTVGDDSESKASYIQVLVTPVAPTAEFSGTPTTGFAPLTVNFTDESAAGTQPISSWLWTFGDGGTSTAQNPSHAYAAPGTYNVSLRVASSVGPDSTTKASYITASVVPVGPTAAFSGTPTSGDAPLTVNFTDGSTAGTSPITSRSWHFGDGDSSSATNPSHVYSTPGTYTVSLRVSTLVGTDTEDKASYVEVSTPPAAPTADFSGTPTGGFAPLTVNFTDLSANGGAAIGSWSWTFGDGGTSTAQNPSHIYTVPGTYNVSLTATNSVGPGSVTKTGYVTASIVPLAPTAAFSGTPTSGDAPLSVTFTDESSIGTAAITSWAWSFGDGGTSTAQNPSHNYAAPGTYTVALRVENSAGPDSTTKEDYITANTVPPTAGFSGTPTSGDAPLTVNFTDASTPGTSPINSRLWSFGDGGSATGLNPSHTYTVPGTYSVALIAASSHGTDTENKTSYVVVSAPSVAPTADFSASPTSGAAPLSVTFTDASANGSAPITSWLWAFGDGGTSTSQNPSHNYVAPGTYSVSLRVENSVGPDSTTKAAYITANAVPPTAAFSGTPTSGGAPLNVQFTDESIPGSSAVTSRLWDFGDGNTSTAVSASHAYADSGNYSVALTVTTADGTDTESKASYVQVSIPPTVDFSASRISGFAPLAVDFTDMSASNGATITSWSWDFGDGATSTSQNPSHTYTVPGTYTVSLTATNVAGTGSRSRTDFIQVGAALVPPTAAFSATPTSGTAPLTVQFTDESAAGSSPITARLWDFGDGSTSTEENPVHVYTTPEDYTVVLGVATDDGDDTEDKEAYIQVSAAPTVPTVDFSADQTSGFAPLSVAFADLSLSNGATITSWSWNFGDGETSALQNPSHTYATPGTYTVSLTASNSVGPDSTTKANYITASVVPVGPTAAFSGTPTTGDAPLTVQFTDESTAGTSPITARLWNFGDGDTSIVENPSHVYTTPGSYTVVLGVATADGSDTEDKAAYIQVLIPPAAPTVDFFGDVTSGDAPLTVQFTDLSTDGGATITSWSWDFGDGETSTEQSPSHTFTAPGTYTVSLTATNSVGPGSATRTDYITVTPTP